MAREPAPPPASAKEPPELVTTRISRWTTSATTQDTNTTKKTARADVRTIVSAMEEEHVIGSDSVGEPQDLFKLLLPLTILVG
jgi:hypothetical protein